MRINLLIIFMYFNIVLFGQNNGGDFSPPEVPFRAKRTFTKWC